MGIDRILWRRLDTPGHDHAILKFEHEGWHIDGCALFVEDSRAARLDYRVRCDASWRTIDARVTGWIGDRLINMTVEADSERRWRVNGDDVPDVTGCIDLDLSFTPCTNLLPIRRLGLAIGEVGDVRSAWLAPDFTVQPLPQRYRRTGEATYHYESPAHDFTADLRVNEAGFVTHYPGLWEIESTAAPAQNKRGVRL